MTRYIKDFYNAKILQKNIKMEVGAAARKERGRKRPIVTICDEYRGK